MKVLKNLGTLGMLVAPVMVVSCGCTTASLDGDSTTENTNENPVDTNDDEVVEETTELVNKSAEELELDAFEDLWGYRPHQPLAAYPELTGSLVDDLEDDWWDETDYLAGYNADWGDELSYFTADNKQELYTSLDSIDHTSYEGHDYGDVVFELYSSSGPGITTENGVFTKVYAIYYEVYDILHDWEIENERWWPKRGEDIDWDYEDPYSSYVQAYDDNGDVMPGYYEVKDE